MERRLGYTAIAAIAVLEFLDVFGRIDLVLGRLARLGSVGQMIATVITSPSFRLALIIVGFGLVLYRKRQAAKRSIPLLSIRPDELVALYRDHTSYQANQLFAAYQGRRLQIKGNVYDIAPDAVGGTISIMTTVETTTVFLRFSKKKAKNVVHLNKGDAITAVGTIKSATNIGVDISDCELI